MNIYPNTEMYVIEGIILVFLFIKLIQWTSGSERRKRIRAMKQMPINTSYLIEPNRETVQGKAKVTTSRKIVGRDGNTRQSGRIYDQTRPKFADSDNDDEADPRWQR